MFICQKKPPSRDVSVTQKQNDKTIKNRNSSSLQKRSPSSILNLPISSKIVKIRSSTLQIKTKSFAQSKNPKEKFSKKEKRCNSLQILKEKKNQLRFSNIKKDSKIIKNSHTVFTVC